MDLQFVYNIVFVRRLIIQNRCFQQMARQEKLIRDERRYHGAGDDCTYDKGILRLRNYIMRQSEQCGDSPER